jgi:hypothetical protein
MISSVHPRIRIALVLLGAFVISGTLIRYFTSEPNSPPSFQMQKISDDFSQTVADGQSSLLALVESVQLPSFETVQAPTPTAIPTQIPTPQELPSTPPTSIPISTIVPTTSLHPTIPYFLSPSPSRIAPTAIPKPTKTPKPTKVPKPTAIVYPPINTDTRPGTNITEIIQEAGMRACVPPALIMAIKTIETGDRFKNESAKTIKIYNTYGWWKTGAGNPCFGYGYHTQTGIVPQDSISAGTSCSRAVGDPTDIGIMGLMQVSQEEETVTRKYTSKFLPKNIDRRVLFDNVLIFAIATKNRVGSISAKSCTDWPDDAIKLAAEKHHGVCVYDYGTGNAGNYCTKVLSLYKSFR